MKKLFVLTTLFIFLNGCFSNPYTNKGTSFNSSNLYQSSIEEPTKMRPCEYSSIDGKEIVLLKSPAENDQNKSTNGQMTTLLNQNGYPLVKVRPSFTASNVSFEKYSEYEGKIIGEVEAQYESVAEMQGILNAGKFTNYYHKIALTDCSIVYINTGVGQMQYASKETYDEAKTLVGNSIWINDTANFEYYSDSYFSHLEKVKVIEADPAIYTRQNDQLSSETVSSVILKVKNSKEGTATIPYNTDFFFTQDPIDQSWSVDIINTIKNQEIRIGMSKEQVLLSWGKPYDINSTVTAESRDEQWVYGDDIKKTYLYFENGELTAYQN